VRILAVDPGGRRIGLAIGDDETGVASPLEIVAYGGVNAAAELIRAAAAEQAAGLVVIGLPTDADGQRTPACARSEALAAELRRLGALVALQPELLTTNEARRRARDLGLAARAPVDHLAAQVLLEEFLATRRATRR
jgi:putative Holliday junction resolvase